MLCILWLLTNCLLYLMPPKRSDTYVDSCFFRPQTILVSSPQCFQIMILISGFQYIALLHCSRSLPVMTQCSIYTSHTHKCPWHLKYWTLFHYLVQLIFIWVCTILFGNNAQIFFHTINPPLVTSSYLLPSNPLLSF